MRGAGGGDHVDRQLPEVSIELAGEPKGGGHSGHGEGHQVVQVPVGGVGQLKGPKRRDVLYSITPYRDSTYDRELDNWKKKRKMSY